MCRCVRGKWIKNVRKKESIVQAHPLHPRTKWTKEETKAHGSAITDFYTTLEIIETFVDDSALMLIISLSSSRSILEWLHLWWEILLVNFSGHPRTVMDRHVAKMMFQTCEFLGKETHGHYIQECFALFSFHKILSISLFVFNFESWKDAKFSTMLHIKHPEHMPTWIYWTFIRRVHTQHRRI